MQKKKNYSAASLFTLRFKKRVGFTREYKEVDIFDVKSWFICHFHLLVYFDEVNSTCAYVMFQTTQFPVLLLLIKNVPEEAFI